MSEFQDGIIDNVRDILSEKWDIRDGRQVPSGSSLPLSRNEAIRITGTVLYADMAGSTRLVADYDPRFAARIFKCYLASAGQIIRKCDGDITAYDGDRIMAVFLGDQKNTNAIRSALAISSAVNGINTEIQSSFSTSYSLRHGVGIDTSELLCTKTGVRDAHDLVWVGRSANLAAKLSALREAPYSLFITDTVYDASLREVKISTDGRSMWEPRQWTSQKMRIYRSSWRWAI